MQKKLALLLVLAMVVACLAACEGATTGGGNTNTNTDSNTTNQGDTNTGDSNGESSGSTRDDVVVRVEATWGTFDPFKSTLYVEYFEMNQMYEALTWVNDDGEITPVLAESWEISDDGTEITLNIRQGVKFHSGDELKASDVAFTLNTAKEEVAVRSHLGSFIEATATDDYTVVCKLETPFAPFMSFISNIRIVNEAYYKEHNGDLDTNVNGTGPYKLVDVDLNSVCHLTAFEDYWQGPPAIKDITFTIITDDTTAAVSYMAGEVDFIMCPASQYLEISAQPEQYAFAALPTKHTALLSMNHEREPFNNKLVRQALNYATDRETMCQVAFEGYAEPAWLQGNETCFGINYDYAVQYPYDLEKAKELLIEAGYPDGVDLGTMYTIAGSYFDKCAVVFQSSIMELGCTVELVGMDSTAMTAEILAGNFDMATPGQSFSTDFAYASRQYTTSGIGSGNYGRYSNPVVDELFAEAEAETDSNKRLELYGQVIQIVTDDAVDIPLFHKNLMFAWNQDLNCVVHPDSSYPYFVYNWSWK